MNIRKALIKIYFIIRFVNSQLSDIITSELNLTNQLFIGYKKTVRPTDDVIVYISLQKFQLIGIDEKNQIMTSSFHLIQIWEESRLSWDPRSYNNITDIVVPMDTVWKPMTVVLNAANGDGFLPLNKEYSYINIQSDGYVFIITKLISIQTRCNLNVQNYPFDNQTCSIVFSSWPLAGSGKKISYSDYRLSINDGNESSVNNSIWDITSFSNYGIENGYTLKFSLQRKSLFYIMNSIIPCEFLNIIILLAFFIPFANQMALGKLIINSFRA